MIFSAAVLSSLLGLASSQACPDFGGLRNPDIPNPSIFLAPASAFYADNVYTFALNLAPASSSNVVVVPSVNNTRLTTRPAALTFSPTNFTTPQTVEIIVPNGSNMDPIVGQSPLSLSFAATNQNFANTTCIPVNSVRTVSVPLTLNTRTRGGGVAQSPGNNNCRNSFANILNAAMPSPYVWVTPNATTYVDNVWNYDVQYALTQSVNFTVTTNSATIVPNVTSIVVSPSEASADVAFPVRLSIASGIPVTSLSFPYNVTLSFTPQGQSFGIPPVSFNFLFNGETNGFGIGGYCFIDCFLY